MIIKRLFERYQINTAKNLGIQARCPRPFDTVLVDKMGSCYACECQSWLPQSIGNLQIKDMNQILQGTMRVHLQGSITDGTYRYCNEHQCSYIKSNAVLLFNISKLLNLNANVLLGFLLIVVHIL